MVRRRSVELQAARVLASPVEDMGAEGDLFVVALAGLRRWCGEARGDHRVRKAVGAFDEAVPEAVVARDVLEHFDEYSRNRGRLQGPPAKRKGRGPRVEADPPIFYEQNASGVVLHIAGVAQVNVRHAAEAADELAGAVLDALTR